MRTLTTPRRSGRDEPHDRSPAPEGVSTPRAARRGRATRRLVGAALIAFALPLAARGASGQAADPQSGELPLGVLLPDDRILPALAALDVGSDAYRAAYDAWTSTQRDIADARRTATRNEALVGDLAATRARLRGELDDRRALLRSIVYDLGGLDDAMRVLVVSSYTRGGPIGSAAAMFDVGAVTDELYVQTLEREVGNDQLRRRANLRQEIALLEADISARTTDLGELADRAFVATSTIEESTRRAAEQTARLPALERTLRDARLAAPVTGTDLPLVALDAYLRAAGTMAAEKPACGLQWQMLAALGRIESRHGNVNGATLRADGRASVPIIGIALTGDDGTALVPDTDDGVLDGDDQVDRAVGPMQFIPSTWYAFRRDGNGDRVSDPQSLYDAALTAAAYLCAGTRTLTTTDGLRAAYLSYNRSTSYVNTALDNLDRYRRLVVPTVPKVR